MYVNIYDYFDRWAVTYIVYHSSHLREYGDVSNAINVFNNNFWREIADIDHKAQSNQIDAIKSMMSAQTPSAASGLKIIDRLQNGLLLDETLERISEAINKGIDAAGGTIDFDNYNQIITSSKNFSQMLSGTPQVQQVNEFFDLLIDALNRAQWLNPAVLDALSRIGQQLIGTNFAIDQQWSNIAQSVTTQEIGEAQKVIDALSRAVQKMETSGSVNARSFASTISYIFSSVIGDQISRIIIANGIAIADEQIENVIDSEIKRSKSKLTRVTSRNKKYTNTININLFDKEVLQLKVRGSAHQDYTIEIANSSDLSWYKKRKKKPINVHREASLRDYFTDPEEKYLAYNMIAHRYTGPDFEEAFENIQMSIAASFFNEWLQGGQIGTITKNLQFVIVKGKVYSIARIIENICWSLLRDRSSNSFQMDIETDKINKWQGKGPNWDYAMKRSDMVNEIMNTFIIAGSLNSNILTQYAY